MAINSQSTITNSFVPNFILEDPKDGDILLYDGLQDAFKNNDGSGLNLSLDASESIQNYTITKEHLSASFYGGLIGQVLAIGTAGDLRWVNLTSTDPSTISIGGLLDVNTGGAIDDSVLLYNDTSDEWEVGAHTIEGLADTNVITPADAEMLFYDGGTSLWINKEIGITDLSDVDTTTVVPVLDDILKFDGTNFVPVQLASIVIDIDDLGDVVITLPAMNDGLVWNGLNWVNAPVDYANVANTPDLSIYAENSELGFVAFSNEYSELYNRPVLFDGQYSSLTGIPTDFAPITHFHTVSEIYDIGSLNIPTIISDLTDVSSTVPTSGDLLSWTGFDWAPLTNAPVPLETASDVTITGLLENHLLKSVGGEWVNTFIVADDISDFITTVDARNEFFNFAELADAGTVADGYMSWLSGEVVYNATIPSTDVVGLADVAYSGSYLDIPDFPLTMPPSAHSHTAASLDDVIVISPTAKDTLVWSGSVWENAVLDLKDLSIGTGAVDQFIMWDGVSAWIPSKITLSQLNDMGASIASPVANDLIKRVGAEWVSAKVDYSELTGTPPPADYSGLTGTPPTVDYADLTGTPPTVDYSELTGTQPDPVTHTHFASEVSDFDAAVDARNTAFNFVSLTDAGTPATGFMKWNAGTGEAEYITTVDYSELTGTQPAPVSHTHVLSEITDFSGATIPITELIDVDATPVNDGFLRWNSTGTLVTYETSITTNDIVGLSLVATTGDYDDIAFNKPTISTVGLTGEYSDLLNIAISFADIVDPPSTYAPSLHGHAIADITGLQADLDAKIDITVENLPQLTVDYNTQIDNKPLPAPTNNSFSFVGLNDTSNVDQTQRRNRYLRWDPTGQEVIYETQIDIDVISGLPPVAIFGRYEDLLDIPTVFPSGTVDYSEITGKPDLTEYAKTNDLDDLAFTGNWADINFKPPIFDGKYTSLSLIPEEFKPEYHQHDASDITGLIVSLNLNDLNNVSANPSVDGEVLTWNANTQKWYSTSASKIVDLDDVSDELIRSNKYLRWNPNGSEVLFEENIDVSNITGLTDAALTGTFDSLSDTLVTSQIDGEVLAWDASALGGNGAWVNSSNSGGSGSSTLAGLIDTSVPSPTDGYSLVWNAALFGGTGGWTDAAVTAGGATTIGSLLDTNISVPSVDQYLAFDGAGDWINKDLPDFTAVGDKIEDAAQTTFVETELAAGKIIMEGLVGIDMTAGTGDIKLTTTGVNSTIIEGSINLDIDGGGTVVWPPNGNPNPNQVIKYGGGTNLFWADGTETIEFLDDLSDTNVPSPNENEVLTYVGGNWIAKSLSDVNDDEPSGVGKDNLHELNDVDNASTLDPIHNTFLQYKKGTNGGNDKWNAVSLQLVTETEALDDVTYVNLEADDLLQFDGSVWVNKKPQDLDFGGGGYIPDTGQTLKAGMIPDPGQYLRWDQALNGGNGAWYNTTVSNDGGIPAQHNHVASEVSGTFLASQIPLLDTSKIETGQFDDSYIFNVDGGKITGDNSVPASVLPDAGVGVEGIVALATDGDFTSGNVITAALLGGLFSGFVDYATTAVNTSEEVIVTTGSLKIGDLKINYGYVKFTQGNNWGSRSVKIDLTKGEFLTHNSKEYAIFYNYFNHVENQQADEMGLVTGKDFESFTIGYNRGNNFNPPIDSWFMTIGP